MGGTGYTTSWSNGDNAYFPYVNDDGTPNFNYTDNDFNDNWLWVVEASTFVPRLLLGGVCFFQPPLRLFFPAAEHLANLIGAFGEQGIFFRVQRLTIPTDL